MAPCDNSFQCTSEMCTSYISKTNFCYGCIPETNTGSPFFGKELSSHCLEEEYCSQDDYSCKQEAQSGDTCQSNNNFMCSTKLCSGDSCVDCTATDGCNDQSECVNGECQFKHLDNGDSCSGSDKLCSSGLCLNGTCNGNSTNGTECHNVNECQSLICDYQTCGGPTEHIIPSNTSVPTDGQPTYHPAANQADGSQPLGPVFYLLVAAISMLLLLLIIVCVCYSRKNKEKTFETSSESGLSRPESTFSDPAGMKRGSSANRDFGINKSVGSKNSTGESQEYQSLLLQKANEERGATSKFIDVDRPSE